MTIKTSKGLLCGLVLALQPMAAMAQPGPTAGVAVKSVKVSTDTVYDWVLSEGIAQGIRREYLNFERGGKVTFIADDGRGLPVRAGSQVRGPAQGEAFGQLLARVDERSDSELVRQNEAALLAARVKVSQAESQFKQAENNLSLATTNFERTESVWEKRLIAKERFESSRTELLNAKESLSSAKAELAAARSQVTSAIAQLNQAKVGLEKTSIFAPFDGVLRKVSIREGDYWGGPAAAQTDREREAGAAMVVVDNSQYEITLNIPYYAGDHLAERQKVVIGRSPAALGEAAKTDFAQGAVTFGEVFSVSPSISLDKRAIEVKVHTSQGAELLKDGLFVTAWIMVAEKHNALTVPNEAIVMRNNRPFVYTVDGEGKADLQAVSMGIQDLDQVEILDGLSAGMQVITTGKHKLVDGTPVRIVTPGNGERDNG